MEDKKFEYIEECHFNAERDVQAVVPTDVLNLAECFVNGVIPDNVIAPDVDYDGVEDPAKIVGRPANNFESIHMVESIKKAQSSASSKAEAEGNQ